MTTLVPSLSFHTELTSRVSRSVSLISQGTQKFHLRLFREPLLYYLKFGEIPPF